MSDIDFKKLFEEEFEKEEISVSEDLIARTMAAIKAEEKKEMEPDKVVPVKNLKKKKMLKAIYGIAAALVIGVAVIAILSQSSFSSKEDRATEASASANYTQADSIDNDSLKMTNAMADSTPNDTDYDGAMAYESATIADDDFAKDDTCVPETEAATDASAEAGGKADEISFSVNDHKYISDMEDFVEEYKSRYSLNSMNKQERFKEVTEGIRNSETYDMLSQNPEAVAESLYTMLKESSEDGEKEYVEAILIQNLTGKNFNDENGNPVWTTGKEYLKLYEDSLR